MNDPVIDDSVIHVDRLQKSFGPKSVLDGVSLSLEPGTVLGLLGANGSGKTTLIKCALGLLRPTAGSVSVFGEDAWDLSAAAKARLGYVPQEVTSYPWMRVRQVIAYTAAFYPKWNQPFVDDLCRRWHLPLEDRVGTLSTGQLQTVGIVLALGHEPELLILDEPVASLDPSPAVSSCERCSKCSMDISGRSSSAPISPVTSNGSPTASSSWPTANSASTANSTNSKTT